MKVQLESRNFLSINDVTPQELLLLIDRAQQLKQSYPSNSKPPLKGKTLALLFEKPSLRTRVSFEVAMEHLGGHAIHLSQTDIGIGSREPISDIGKVLSRWVHGIAYRTFDHRNIEDLAMNSTVPIINALSDLEHPCQALGDLVTIKEKFKNFDQCIISFVGDGNNVASSLALAAMSVGSTFRIASPKGYGLPQKIVDRAKQIAHFTGAKLQQVDKPEEAVKAANVIYTDVWASMGQEEYANERKNIFAEFKVTDHLLRQAKPSAIFMHDMPVHYGEEIEPGFLDHPQSVAFDQAENRLYAQKAILESLLFETSKKSQVIPHA